MGKVVKLSKFEWFALATSAVGVIGSLVALYHLGSQV